MAAPHRSPAAPRRARAGTLVLAAALAAGAVACGSSDRATPTTTTAAASATPPDLVGTWTGPYTFPLAGPDGSPQAVTATETLVIEHQDGELLWGVDEYVDAGQTVRIPVRGQVDAEGQVTLAEEGGAFRGRVEADGSLTLRFARTDDQYTAFTVRLTRR